MEKNENFASNVICLEGHSRDEKTAQDPGKELLLPPLSRRVRDVLLNEKVEATRRLVQEAAKDNGFILTSPESKELTEGDKSNERNTTGNN